MLNCMSSAQNRPAAAVMIAAALLFITWLGNGSFPLFVLLNFYNMIIIISDTGFSVKEK